MNYVTFKKILSNGDDSPDRARINVNVELIKRIKKMSEIVCLNNYACIKDQCFIKYLTGPDAVTVALEYSDEYNNFERYEVYDGSISNSSMEVTNSLVLWSGTIRHTNIEVSTNYFEIEKLIQIERFLTRVINKDFGYSITSIVNEIVNDLPGNIKETFVLLNDEFIMGPYEYKSINQHVRNLKLFYPAVQTFSIITVDADDVIRIKETI